MHVWDLRAIRSRLAAMGLDWDAPPYSDDDPADARRSRYPHCGSTTVRPELRPPTL